MRLQHPEWLHVLWCLPALASLFWLTASGRRQALLRFLSPAAALRLAPRRALPASLARGSLLLTAMGLIAVALCRPGLNPVLQKTAQSGRDVIFLLDVSRSMLAQDLRPNRLERAKILISDALEAARRSSGDRVGIIIFAGTTQVVCPLTTDYSFAQIALDTVTTDSIGRGGTLIGDAIRAAQRLFIPRDEEGPVRRTRDIFLLTDGEDHDSFPREAAETAAAKGIRVVAIGLGSETEGATVPAQGRGGTLSYEGEVVRSRLDSASLRGVAEATPGGVYLNVGTGTTSLDRVYDQLVRSAEQTKRDQTEKVRYQEIFQAFLLAAILLLCLECLFHER